MNITQELIIPKIINGSKCGDSDILVMEVEFSGEVEYKTIDSKK